MAIIRLSGNNAVAIASALSRLPSQKKLSDVPSHTVHLGWIINKAGTLLDQVMISVMLAPRTFTGQDIVEITCHNNQFIIEDIITATLEQGARQAQEGEFTQRAFLNGKIDLIQAEAINDLLRAQTQQALKKSLAQLEGTFSQWIASLEHELIRALAWCEASFEFLDEEQEFGHQIHLHLEDLLKRIEQIKKTFDLNQQIRQGVTIALIGSVNAGKSSLFNALLGQKRSIVTDIPGTTRDTVEGGLYHKGIHWTLIDTAGIRPTDDIIEKEGIDRSFGAALKADLILLIFDGSRALTRHEHDFYEAFLAKHHNKIILVHNKADLPEDPCHFGSLNPSVPALRVSYFNNSHADLLMSKIEDKVAQLLANALEAPFLLNQRQYKLILGLEQQLFTIITMLGNGTVQYELISYHLREALEHITELTGKSITEAGLDTVFKEFCVGK